MVVCGGVVLPPGEVGEADRQAAEGGEGSGKAAGAGPAGVIAVTACPLLALLLSVGLLNRAVNRHRLQAATFHSSRILP
ncbi:hypothetical protein SSPO_041220 [Streptomyces antimycoticus]|uniref:Uncharacterized protein n=1 Tax=Streptomyces antimycoticus TaxID=68175 RepID=A0A499UIC9_9ACTN|nr:hypothetical protein SSPO_041220 [Streptomyces antimycoticus]